MLAQFQAAIMFYLFALYNLYSGYIYKLLGWNYKTQVQAKAFGDLLFSGDVFSLLTVWISWKMWLVLWLVLGTWMLVAGIQITENEKRN